MAEWIIWFVTNPIAMLTFGWAAGVGTGFIVGRHARLVGGTLS